MDIDKQTRLLILEHEVKLEERVHRLQKGWRLCFACDPFLQSKKVRLFTNYPSKNEPADYEKYRELLWNDDKDISDGYATISDEIELNMPGSFEFYYTTDQSCSVENAHGHGYILIDPELVTGVKGDKLPLDAIQLHTIMPKLLGTVNQWKKQLAVSYHSSYNVMHFTPLQKLNKESNSSYSISDQLALNPAFSSEELACSNEWLADFIQTLNKDWHMLSITDMVYNHTANDSDWLVSHPESAYNLQNSPHLKPAFLLDRLLYYTSQKVASSHLSQVGIPAAITSEEHINALRSYLKDEISKLKLSEFYIVDTEKITEKFLLALKETFKALDEKSWILSCDLPNDHAAENLKILQDKEFRRLQSTIDIKSALKLYTSQIKKAFLEKSDYSITASSIAGQFMELVGCLNANKTNEIDSHLSSAVENVLNGVRYRFTEARGLKLPRVTNQEPLVYLYFVNKREGDSSIHLSEDELICTDNSRSKYIMAHNGWVMNDDPMRDFAMPDSNVYLRRELVVWGDSVKLRYGSRPEDSPYLWGRMEEYTRWTVNIFHGIRLDNCHSTPVHVAEHMMRLARSVRPNLYVIAELFTSSEAHDNLFVNRLGINSLIREGLSAWDAHEQGRLVYRYGGRPVGSFFQPKCQILKPSVAHALFMDATHDNPSIAEKRTANDAISLAAFVSMSSCATGSNRGYDELVPHHINVVSEQRLYQLWSDEPEVQPPGLCNFSTGIIRVKSALNKIHYHMGIEVFDQVYVHDLSADVVSITRHSPTRHSSVVCVVRSAFNAHGHTFPDCDDLVFEGEFDKVLLYAALRSTENHKEFEKDHRFINGLSSYDVLMMESVSINKVPGISFIREADGRNRLSFTDFPPGSVLIISVQPPDVVVRNCEEIRRNVRFIHDYLDSSTFTDEGQKLKSILDKLTLSDLSAIQFHCDSEEHDITGYGAYNIPNYGSLVYTGLQGVFTVMEKISNNNDLGHPFVRT